MAVKNNVIVDKIWETGSNQYREAVPQASQSGLDAVRDAIFKSGDRSIMNQFADGLMDVVGNSIVKRTNFANPLAPFKSVDLLPAGGNIVQEIAVGKIRARGYDILEGNLFAQVPAEVEARFHKVEREDRYDLTINATALRSAFATDTGLNTLVATQLSMLETSDQADEFEIMKNLILKAASENELFRKKVHFENPELPTALELKYFSQVIRTMAEQVGFLTTKYTALGMPTATKRSDLVLITTPEIKAALAVNVLADAFHIEQTDLASEVVIIDEFPLDGAYAMLVDRAWFICGDYVKAIDNFWNPKTRSINYYLHHWGVYSYSPFSTAILFGEYEDTTVPTVNVELDAFDAQVQDVLGNAVDTFDYTEDLRLVVATGVTTTPENSNVTAPSGYSVNVQLAGPDGKAINPTIKTGIGRNGEVRVQKGLKKGSTITIVATSTYVNPSGKGVKPASPLTDTVVLTVA